MVARSWKRQVRAQVSRKEVEEVVSQEGKCCVTIVWPVIMLSIVAMKFLQEQLHVRNGF